MDTLQDDLAYVRRAAGLDGQVSGGGGQVSPDAALRAALDRYVDEGIVDHHLYRHDGTYHAVVDLIRMALS